MRALYIFRKDLRIKENKTLSLAAKADSLDFVYFCAQDFKEKSSFRKNFIYESLIDLSQSLEQRLSIIDSLDQKFLEQYDEIFISKNYNEHDQWIERDLSKLSIESNFKLRVIENSNLYRLADLPFSVEDLPFVFTSFRKKIEKHKPLLNKFPPSNLPPVSSHLENVSSVQDYFKDQKLGKKNPDFKGGEQEALSHLEKYFWKKDLARTYKNTRNGMLQFEDSTKFSPWLSVGCISPITIYEELQKYEENRIKNDSTYWIFFELLWREYFKLYSLKHGEDIFSLKGIKEELPLIRKDGEAPLEKWKQGSTGVPFVDAHMRELFLTGWMSNRGRQNVASYLSKDLNVDWRKGAQWFETMLIDYDVECNWGNWNYLAGVGADPRDRKFNIERQASIYDPEGLYIQKWLKKEITDV